MKVSEVKTNESVMNLCSFLSNCRSDIDDVAEHSRNLRDVVVQLRSIALSAALMNQEGVFYLDLPDEQGKFSFEDSVKNKKMYGKTVFTYNYKDQRNRFTTLDGVVNAGIPTLVEARTPEPQNIPRYFGKMRRKQEVLDELYPQGYGWILMLPLDYVKVPEALRGFERQGRKVAIMPYTSVELRRAVQKYGKDERKDSKMLAHS